MISNGSCPLGESSQGRSLITNTEIMVEQIGNEDESATAEQQSYGHNEGTKQSPGIRFVEAREVNEKTQHSQLHDDGIQPSTTTTHESHMTYTDALRHLNPQIINKTWFSPSIQNLIGNSHQRKGTTLTQTVRGGTTATVQDRHPHIPVSQVLLFPTSRPGRLIQRKQGDPDATKSYGDPIAFRAQNTTRVLFQNVKGLTHTTSCDDYRYYISAMISYSIDIFGMTETNTGWQHRHLQEDFKLCVKRQFPYGRTSLGLIDPSIDTLTNKETFQAGGNLQVVQGPLVTTIHGHSLFDETGLGRWSGNTFQGHG